MNRLDGHLVLVAEREAGTRKGEGTTTLTTVLSCVV